MPTIGDKMRTRPPVPLRGQPESNWFRVEEQFEAEVKQYLEDTALADAIAALTAALAALTTLATDTLWDVKGDLAAATGPDAATRLPVGTAYQVLSVDAATSTGLKWDHLIVENRTSDPGSPAVGQLWLRTDL